MQRPSWCSSRHPSSMQASCSCKGPLEPIVSVAIEVVCSFALLFLDSLWLTLLSVWYLGSRTLHDWLIEVMTNQLPQFNASWSGTIVLRSFCTLRPRRLNPDVIVAFFNDVVYCSIFYRAASLTRQAHAHPTSGCFWQRSPCSSRSKQIDATVNIDVELSLCYVD